LTQKKANNIDITTLDDILNKKYGNRTMPRRKQWESEFQVFKYQVLLESEEPKQLKLP
jgi:hypothetical protein